MRYSIKALFALASLATFTSCSDENLGFTAEEIRYKHSFIDTFGEVDPEHTFNTASLVDVNVAISNPGNYTVKVYTANPRYSENNTFLLGQYDNVEAGNHTFKCDMPQSVETAYIGLIDSNGDRLILPAEVKDNTISANFGTVATRGVINNPGGIVVSTDAPTLIFSEDEVKIPTQTLPEGVNNTGKISQNFEYVSQGSFTIYPVYSITSNLGKTGEGQKLGIYTYDSNGNKSGITWVYQMNKGTLENNQFNSHSCWFTASKDGSAWESVYWFTNNIDNVSLDKCLWNEGSKSFANGYTHIKPQGVTLTIPKGTRFGFVLDAAGSNGEGYYSNSQYNDDQGSPTGSATDGIKDVYGATFYRNGNMYLAFEDWNYATGCDHDYNDVVFTFKEHNNPLPIVIDKDVQEDPMMYIVACEDLGDTDDWDFNDVVFGIEHVSGSNKARIKLLAAGGTLPLEIQYDRDGDHKNYEPITFYPAKTIREVHEAFGVGKKVMVNTGINTREPVYSNYFEVDPNDFNVAADAAKFQIHVTYSDGDKYNIHVPSYADTKSYKCPMAFLIADPNWSWPSERQMITDAAAYPDFANWVRDHLNNDWYGAIWGMNHESNSVLTSSSNAIDLNTSSYASISGNQVTITFPTGGSIYDNYKFIIKINKNVNGDIKFVRFGENTYDVSDVVTDGKLLPGKLTNYYFTAASHQAIEKAVITFDSQVTSLQSVIDEAYWIPTTDTQTKQDPELAINNDSYTFDPIDVTGQSFTISATHQGTGSITYTSSNPSVATVDNNGVVTPVGGGKAYITVSLAADATYRSAVSYVTVNVRRKNSNLAFNNNNAHLYKSLKGDKDDTNVNVPFTTNSGGELSVKSSAEGVATARIDNGRVLVTAVGNGEATITLEQKASDLYYANSHNIVIKVDNYRDGYGYEVAYTDVMDNDVRWSQVASGDVPKYCGYSLDYNIKFVLDFETVYGITDYYVGPGNDKKTIQLKNGDNWTDCTWDANVRTLTYVLPNWAFIKYYQSTEKWISHVYFGGNSVRPTRIYVDKASSSSSKRLTSSKRK